MVPGFRSTIWSYIKVHMYGPRFEDPHIKEGSSRVLEGPQKVPNQWSYHTLDIENLLDH